MAEEMITPDNLSINLLKSTFEAAYMDVSQDSDDGLKIEEACGVFIRPDLESKNRISLYAVFGFKDRSKKIQRLECVNRINEDYIMVCAFATDNGLLFFKYDIMLDGGLTKKALVLAVKRFASIPHAAVQDYGGDIVE